MKKIGFLGLADAVTVAGDVTVPPSVGLEIVRGKSFEPDGGGSCAVGAGSELDDGDQVIATGGVDGLPGCEGGAAGGAFVFPVPQEVAAQIRTLKQINACTRKTVALASRRSIHTRIIQSHLSCVI